MTVELSVFERLLLLNTLPEKGNITTIRIVNKLRDELSFSEEEHKKLNFIQDDGKVKWDDVVVLKDVNFGEKALDITIETFEKLSESGEFTAQHLALYDKLKEGAD